MSDDSIVPGEILPGDEPVTINEGRETETLTVANTGDRPIQVGSHFHFFEANRALEFDRALAFGKRLDILAGTAVRFEPGERADVDLVNIGGKRRIEGMNNLVNGSAKSNLDAALDRAQKAGFQFSDDNEAHETDGGTVTAEDGK